MTLKPKMTLERKFFKIWVWTCFVVFFLMVFPFFVLFTQRESWKPAGHFMNKLWAHAVFGFCFLPCDIVFKFKPNRKQNYIYCANHTSFLDIPSLCYALPGYFLFIGKAALVKVPLFGYMFRNLYIAVDRKSLRSRYDTMIMSMNAVDKGRGLAIFPEGTIPNANTPYMTPFKDGPFRIAIEKKIPVVPVTIPFNWKILPDDGDYTPIKHLMRVVVHEPIDTTNLTLNDVNALRKQTYDIINEELLRQNNLPFPKDKIHEHRSTID